MNFVLDKVYIQCGHKYIQHGKDTIKRQHVLEKVKSLTIFTPQTTIIQINKHITLCIVQYVYMYISLLYLESTVYIVHLYNS